MFKRWHAEPGVRAYLLAVDDEPVGYGEIWEDPDEDEAELARLIVDPARRGRGLGRLLATSLLGETRRLGWVDVWLRVAPDNEPAHRAYAAAGFRRATPAEESAFNANQPVEFVWLRAPD
jgi:ribosomal protein S18 acetylase RimI-like enzyme